MQVLDGYMSRPEDMGEEAGLGDLEGFLREALDGVDERVEAKGAGPAGEVIGAHRMVQPPSFFEPPANPVSGFYEAAQCLTAVSPRGVLSLDANMATGQTGATGSGATAPATAMNDWASAEYAESQGAATGSERFRGLDLEEARRKRNRLAQARLRKRKREKDEQVEVKVANLERENALLASQLKWTKEEMRRLQKDLADRNTAAPTAAVQDAPAAAADTTAGKKEEGCAGYSADLARDILLSGAVEAPSAGKNKVAAALKLLFTSVFLVSEYVPASEDKEQSVRFLGGLGRAMKQAMSGKMSTARSEELAGISGRGAAPGQPDRIRSAATPATARTTPMMPHPTHPPFEGAVPQGYRLEQGWPGHLAYPHGGPAYYHASFPAQAGAPPSWPAGPGPPQHHAAGFQEHPPEVTGLFGPQPSEPPIFHEAGRIL